MTGSRLDWLRWVFLLVIVLARTPAIGEEPEVPKTLAPHEAVREGNRLLQAGDARKAIEFYRHAAERAPSAREITFDEGLALFRLGRYAEARGKFREAAAGAADRLADDALYSEGTTYHAEALNGSADPKTAVSHLESAMQRYQSVLANRPDHQAAREANYKAGMLRRQLRQQMQQQQQSGQQGGEDKEEQEPEQQQSQQQPQEEQQSHSAERKQQEQEEGQPQRQERDEENEQERRPNASEQEQQGKPASETEQREQLSREQAERKLRELMQAVRQRKKDRREPLRVTPVQPVEKDW